MGFKKTNGAGEKDDEEKNQKIVVVSIKLSDKNL